MRSIRRRVSKVFYGVLIFSISYGVTVFVYSFSQRWFLPSSPPKDTVRAGEHIAFPDVQSVTGSPLPLLTEKLTLVTCFSLKCHLSRKSVPFWMRLKTALPKNKVDYVLLGCSDSIADLERFVQATALEESVFFGTCDKIEPVFKIRGGITHCLLNQNGTCLAVWTGMPIRTEYEVERIDEILREVDKHSP